MLIDMIRLQLSGAEIGKWPQQNFETGSTMFREGVKRRRFSANGCQNIDVADRWIRVLQSNASLLNTQLESQNMNCQVDSEK